jgi:PST family polysaccharide transporter
MFSFLKNSLLGVFSVGTRLVSSFFLNKMVALYFGPAGIAQLAHFQNLLTFFTLVPNDGINRGVIKYLAGSDKQFFTFRAYFRTGFYLTLLMFLVITGLLFVARSFFLTYFPPQITWFVLFLTGALLLVLQSFFNAVLMARHKNGLLVLVNTLVALGVIGYVALATVKLAISDFLNGYLLVMGILSLMAVPFSLQGLPKIRLFQPRFSTTAWRHLSKFILMATSVLLFSKGLEYYIRDYLFRHYSVEQTGLWQGVVRISDSYTALYTAVLAYAFYPKVAVMLPDAQKLKKFVQQAFKLLVPVIIMGLALIFLTQNYLFTWLLSSRFKAAQEFLPYQLAGDFCKLLSWLLANILVAQANFKIILVFEAVSALFYLGSFYFFTYNHGLVGTTMAHCAHYVLFLALNLFYFRKLFTA